MRARPRDAAAFQPGVPPFAPEFQIEPRNRREAGRNLRRPGPPRRRGASPGESSKRNFATAACFPARPDDFDCRVDGLKLAQDQVGW
jgi:hypothetical protein